MIHPLHKHTYIISAMPRAPTIITSCWRITVCGVIKRLLVELNPLKLPILDSRTC